MTTDNLINNVDDLIVEIAKKLPMDWSIDITIHNDDYDLKLCKDPWNEHLMDFEPSHEYGVDGDLEECFEEIEAYNKMSIKND